MRVLRPQAPARWLNASHLTKNHEALRILVPQHLADATKALQQSQAPDSRELRVIPQHLLQPVIRNAAAEMVNVVDANVGCEPTQDDRQIVM